MSIELLKKKNNIIRIASFAGYGIIFILYLVLHFSPFLLLFGVSLVLMLRIIATFLLSKETEK